jgi:hypothetical protein
MNMLQRNSDMLCVMIKARHSVAKASKDNQTSQRQNIAAEVTH